MNSYQNMRCIMEDNAHLISMVPVEELLRFGYEVGLKPGMKVLDLCCGYGTVLKIWREAFGIYGVGVDREKSFLDIGTERLRKYGIDGVLLIHEDVTKYRASWHIRTPPSDISRHHCYSDFPICYLAGVYPHDLPIRVF